MIKDIIFALGLGTKIITTFIICIFIGLKLDIYFNSDRKILFVMIFVAFFTVMKTLIGVIKRGRV